MNFNNNYQVNAVDGIQGLLWFLHSQFTSFVSSEILKQYNEIILVLQNVCQGANLTVC